MKKILLLCFMLIITKIFSDTIYFKDKYTIKYNYTSERDYVKIRLYKDSDLYSVSYSKNFNEEISEGGNYDLWAMDYNIGYGGIPTDVKLYHFIKGFTLIQDKEAPTKSSISQNINTVTNSYVTVTFVASDNLGSGVLKYEYSLDNVNWFNGASYQTGINRKLYFRATDKVGNVSEVYTHEVKNIDKIAPTSPGLSADINTLTNKNVTVKVSEFSTDSSGIDHYEYKLETESNWTIGKSKEVSQNATIQFKALDKAGNVSDISYYTVNNIDKVPPRNLEIPEISNVWSKNPYNICIEAYDPGSSISSIEIKKGENDWSTLQKEDFTKSLEVPYSDIFDFLYENPRTIIIYQSWSKTTYTVDSDETLQFRVFDNAGNKKTSIIYYPKVETTAPIIDSISLSDNGNCQNLTIDVTAHDDQSGLSTLFYYGTGLISNTINSVDGVYHIPIDVNTTVNYKIKDIAGNETAVQTKEITNIDKIAPIITIENNEFKYEDNKSSIDKITKFHVLDVGNVNISTINDSQWIVGVPDYPDNKHTYYALKAVDEAGNATKGVFEIDSKAPEISLNTDVNKIFNNSLELKFSATDDNPVKYNSWKYKINNSISWTQINADKVLIYTWGGAVNKVDKNTKISSLTLPIENSDLINGENKIYVKVSDNKGNESPETYYVTINFDNIAPTIDSISLIDNVTGYVYENIEEFDETTISFNWINKISKLVATGSDTNNIKIEYKITKKINNTIQHTYPNSTYSETKPFFDIFDYIPFWGTFLKIPCENTKYYVDVRITDEAGNSIEVNDIEVKIDNKAPVFQSNGTLGNIVVNETLSIISKPSVIEKSVSNESFNLEYGEFEYFIADDDHELNSDSEWQIVSESNIEYSSESDGQKILYFRYVDEAGNKGISSGISFRYDTLGPTLEDIGSISNNSFVLENKIKIESLPTWVDIDTDTSSLKYYISKTLLDESGDFSLLNYQSIPLNNEITLIDLEEGERYIYYSVEDNIGNIGYSTTGLQFIVDKTIPEITSVDVYNKSETASEFTNIKDQGFSNSSVIYIHPTAIDKYTHDEENYNGYIENYSFFTSRELNGDYLSLESVFIDNFYKVSLNYSGVNYIKVRVKDISGNISDDSDTVTVIVDSGKPTNLEIKSKTHPKAVSEQDSVSSTTAYFNFSSDSGMSGIKGYNYKLIKALSTEYNLPDTLVGSQFTEASSIELINLVDNIKENNDFEFYYLEVEAVSNNNQVSDVKSYRFRVDTTPPTCLTIESPTHSISGTYYATKNALLNWKEPLDLTGIEKYYYKILNITDFDNIENIQDYVAENYKDFTSYTEKSINLDLQSVVRTDTNLNPKDGEVVFILVARDWAGEYQYDIHNLKFDIEKPNLEYKNSDNKRYFDLEIENAPGMANFSFTWKLPTDDESGVDYQNIALYNIINNEYVQIYPSNNVLETITKDTINYTAYGVPIDSSNIDYMVMLEIIDNAGNKKIINQFFNNLGEINSNPQVGIPFDNYYYGYRVTGQTVVDASAKLYLPKSLELKKNSLLIESINLNVDDNITEFQSGNYVIDKNIDSPLDFFISGFFFGGYGIELSEDGLKITDPFINLPGNRQLIFNDSLLIASPKSLSSQYPISALYKDYKEFISKNGWRIKSDTGLSFTLKNREFYINEGYLTKYSTETRKYKIFKENSNVALKNISVNSKWDVIEAEILSSNTDPFIIENDSYKVLVNKAILKGSDIIIEDGALVSENQQFTTEGNQSNQISFQDLVVSMDGSLTKGKKFSFKDFNYSYNGTIFTANEIDFLNQGLSVSGTFTTNSNTYLYDGHIFNSDSLDKDIEAVIDTPIIIENFNNHKFEAKNYFLKGNEIIIKSGTLKLSRLLGDSTELNFSKNLILDTKNFNIISSGISSINNNVLSEYNIGSGLTLNKIELGGILNNYSITILDAISVIDTESISAENIILKNISIKSDNKLADSDSILSHQFTIGSFTYTGNNIKYDALKNSITVEDLVLNTDNELDAHLNNLIFTGLEFTTDGIKNYGESTTERSFDKDGWSFNIESFEQRSQGLYAKVNLLLPEFFGSRKLTFTNFMFEPNGSYSSNKAIENQFINIGGWRYLAADIELINGVITNNSGKVRLFTTMGSSELVFSNISLKNDGTITFNQPENRDISFVSENGFKVSANRYQLSKDGIYLSGEIVLPDNLQNSTKNSKLVYTDNSILLKPNGSVVTTKSTDSLEYSVGRIDVSGKSININENGIKVGKNYLKIVGLNNNDLGEIDYYSSGEMKFGGNDFSPITYKPFGEDSLEFSIRGIKLTDNGLNLQSFIKLPENIGGAYIYFDSLTMHSDGTITSDVAIPEVDFTFNNINFIFNDVYFNDESFSIGEALITLPESMENKQIELTNFKLTKDGEFELGNSKIDPFDLWGYTFYIDNLSFGNLKSFSEKGIGFTGGVRLPNNFSVNELAGRRFSIRDLEVPYSGNSIKFNISLDDKIDFKLFDKWDASITGISMNQDFKLVINDGTIDLPREFNSNGQEKPKLRIKNILLDPVTLTMDIKDVEATNLSYTFNELDFAIKSVKLSQDRGLDIVEGSVYIPQNDPSSPKYPNGLDNTTLAIHKLQIKNDFTVGELDVSVSKTESLSILDGMFYLKPVQNSDNYKLALEKDGDNLYLAASASLQLAGDFPDGIKGKSLEIGDASDEYGIKVNIVTGEIYRFDVAGNFYDPITKKGLEYDLFGNSVDTKELRFSYIKESDLFQLSVNGTALTLDNASVPEFLKGTVCEVNKFTIDQTGKISEFESTISLNDKREFFPGIYMENWKIGIEADDSANKFIFSIKENGANGNSIELGNTFPDGIAGTKSSITDFSIDSNGVIGDIDFNISLSPSLNLFGNMAVRGLTDSKYDANKGANLKFVKSATGKDFQIEITAAAKLANSLPSGLAGLELPIHEFTFDTSGKILALDMAVSNLNLTIYGELGLKNGTIGVVYEPVGEDDLIFNIGGSVTMPAAVKNGIGAESFDINKLQISSKRGLLNFEAGVSGLVTANLFAGMSLSFSNITVGSAGVALKGSLNLPSSLAEGLPKSILLNEFKMAWSGEITEISAGISNATVKVGGFESQFTNFVVHKDKITLDTFNIKLPDQMGGTRVGFENAGFDYNGNFFGNCKVDKLVSPDLAGFKIVLYDPDLDVKNSQISFSKVFCKTPDFIGGAEVGISGVQISPTSLNISGGEFRIPDFTVGDGLGFKEVGVSFNLGQNSYYVKGGGKLMVPGLGTFGTTVSFTNPSIVYPIGLEQAYFSWEADGPGIPMASTGMFLNGIRGGLTFGPPIEVPTPLKPMFDNGTRIQLGLSVVDATGGAQVRGNADIWLDITDWDWAFRGDLTVLSGMANAEVLAAITGRGFYGSLKVTLTVVRGQVQVYIFDENGQTIVSGDAAVEFGIDRGALFNSNILGIDVIIPPSQTWVAKGTAQFGKFRKGSGFADGIKGGISIAWFDVSAFVSSSGQLDLWGANEYTLYTPFSGRSGERVLQNRKSRVISLDNRGEIRQEDEYKFTIPGSSSPIKRSSVSSETPNELSKLIFIVAYPEGDPQITAINENGVEYDQFSSNVIIDRTEWGMYFIVTDPEPGNWSLKVDNMPSEDSYSVTVFGNSKNSELDINGFEYQSRLINKPFELNGKITPAKAGIKVEFFARENRDSFTGYKVYETTSDENGEFTGIIDPVKLVDGENFIYINVGLDNEPEIRKFIDGSLFINNYDNRLPAVKNLILSENIEKDLVINFDPVVSTRLKGYKLNLQSETESLEFNLGQMTNFVIPGLENGKYSVSVTTKQSNGLDGESTETVEFTKGEVVKEINRFNLIESEIVLSSVVGSKAEAEIVINVDSPEITGSSYDYASIDIKKVTGDTENSWEIYPNFEKRVDISSGTATVQIRLSSTTFATPGEYKYQVSVSSLSDPEYIKTVPVTLNLDYPEIKIDSVSPKQWEQKIDSEFEVYGSGFVAGTRLFIDGDEIPTTERTFNRIKADIPQTIKQGEHLIELESGNGVKREFTIEVTGPTWSIVSYKNYSEINPGKNTSLFFKVVGINDFNDTVSFEVTNLPENWSTNWISKSIETDTITELEVSVPANTIAGTYLFNITDSENNSIPAEIVVTEKDITPTISSLSNFSVLAGSTLTIYGFGFDAESKVFIGDKELNIYSLYSDKITVSIPDNQISGELFVKSGNYESNRVGLNIKESGYKIYPKKRRYSMQPGEEVIIPVSVSGYSEYVTLKLTNQSPNIKSSLDESYLKLNGYTNLNIKLDSNIPNGSYPITIEGSDGNLSVSEVVTIDVGDAFIFKSEEIPSFMEGVSGSYKIETINGDGEITYKLGEDDYLPSGLSLSKDGVLSGKVQYGQKSKKVTIIATDESRRSIESDFNIVIEENSWPLSKKDGGNSGFNSTPSPAEDLIKWKRGTIIDSKSLIVGNNRVFVRGSKGVSVFSATSGMPLYTIEGSFTDYFYSSDTLFTLDSKGNFTAWEISLGNKKWSRDEVTGFKTDGFRLLLEDHNGIMVINLKDGQLIAENLSSLNGSSIWFNNELLRAENNKIYVFNDNSWEIKAGSLDSTISSMVSDSNNLVILLNNGELLLLDNEYNITKRVATNHFNSQMVLTESGVLILSDGYLSYIELKTFAEKYSLTTYNGELVSAKEKFFIAGSNGLEARNIYTGDLIWNKLDSQLDIAIVGEELFLLESDGDVVCYNGRDNIFAPVTTVTPSPIEPNGNNGYYTISPTITVESSDAETYVDSLMFKYAELDYKEYTESQNLPDGEYSFSAYGVDSHGMRGITESQFYKVDTVNPVSTLTKELTSGDRGFTVSKVKYTLNAEDETSQIKDIYYTLNGVDHIYTNPVEINDQGNYTFTWWSEDLAGNIEDKDSFSVYVDLEEPVIWRETYQGRESGTLYLFASDSFSGVNRIEYRVNGGEIRTYVDPVNLPAGKYYDVSYRAVDNAELKSPWENIVIDQSSIEEIELIQELDFAWGKRDRYIDRNLQIGDSMYLVNDGKKKDKELYPIESLPEYLLGGELIVGDFKDKYATDRNLYSFKAGVTIDLYLVKNRLSNIKLDDSWSLVDEEVEINRDFFRLGADIYHKIVEQGEIATVNGSDIKDNKNQKSGANLIVAKRNLKADLNIFSPNPGKELYPLSSNWFAATHINGEVKRHWYYKLKDTETVDLGETFSGEFDLPYVNSDTTMELIVEVEALNPVDPTKTDIIRQVREYKVVNPGKVDLYEPVSGSQILLNSNTPLNYKVIGMKGEEVEKDVVWESESGSVTASNFYPVVKGLTTLKSTFNIYNDFYKINERKLNVVEKYQTELFDFGKDLTYSNKEHDDGRVYGFSKDYRHRVGETTYISIPKGKYWSNDRINKGYIAFEDDDEFNYLVNNGLYRVKVLLGPVSRYEIANVTIEGVKTDLPRSKDSRYYTVETSAVVKDNNLTISGSFNLQVMEVEVERIKTPIDTVVTHLESYRVMEDMKWYIWNPDHYFPELDWYNSNRENKFNKNNKGGRK